MCDGVIDIVHLDLNHPSALRGSMTSECKSGKRAFFQMHTIEKAGGKNVKFSAKTSKDFEDLCS